MGRIGVNKLINIVAGLAGIYHIIVLSGLLTFIGIFTIPFRDRAASLLFLIILVYLYYHANRSKGDEGRVAWYDILLCIGGVVGAGFIVFFYDTAFKYVLTGYMDTKGITLGIILMIALLEAVRRVAGWILPAIIMFFLAITFFQPYLPGILHGPEFPFDQIGYSVYISGWGIFGIPFGVACTILIVFLIFGQMLQKAGAGEWFLNVAISIAGWMRGGPAKACVLASALFGSINGSPAANAATTGAFTIPLMIKSGYKKEFAGAVEAVSSTGGNILPPIMGAVAFVAAEWLAVPYAKVALAALIPAILYYIIVVFSVHIEAVKTDLKPIPKAQLPSLSKVMKEGWFYLLPMGVLIYFLLFKMLDPALAGLYSLPILIGSSFFSRNKDHWMTPQKIWDSIVGGVKNWVLVGTITASIGIMIGSLELSGLGIKFSSFILELGGGNLTVVLIMVAIASIILGMGVDALTAYFTLTILVAPALLALGVPELAAHLFVIYWNLVGFITPPVCIAVYVTCAISEGHVWKTGKDAVRIGIGAFLVPFAFILNPPLLLNGSTGEIVYTAIITILGAACLVMALSSYGLTRMNWIQRIILFNCAWLLISPHLLMDAIGFAMMSGVILWQFFQIKKDKPVDLVKSIS